MHQMLQGVAAAHGVGHGPIASQYNGTDFQDV
jgi:hypothetical protein